MYALQSYEFVRKARAEKILACTREAKRVYESLDEYANASDERVDKTANELVNWLWQGKLDLDGEVERGKKEFDRLRGEGAN